MADLQTQLRDSERTFNELRDRTGIDAEFKATEKDGKAWGTTCTRAWRGVPIVYDGELRGVMRSTIALWIRILKDALVYLDGQSDADPTGEIPNAN